LRPRLSRAFPALAPVARRLKRLQANLMKRRIGQADAVPHAARDALRAMIGRRWG
jgi:hypothetical protein